MEPQAIAFRGRLKRHATDEVTVEVDLCDVEGLDGKRKEAPGVSRGLSRGSFPVGLVCLCGLRCAEGV